MVFGQGIERYDELDVLPGDRVGIVIEKTPFCPKRGGQDCDRGTITFGNGIVIDVDEVIEPVPNLIIHWGTVRRGT